MQSRHVASANEPELSHIHDHNVACVSLRGDCKNCQQNSLKQLIINDWLL